MNLVNEEERDVGEELGASRGRVLPEEVEENASRLSVLGEFPARDKRMGGCTIGSSSPTSQAMEEKGDPSPLNPCPETRRDGTEGMLTVDTISLAFSRFLKLAIPQSVSPVSSQPG